LREPNRPSLKRSGRDGETRKKRNIGSLERVEEKAAASPVTAEAVTREIPKTKRSYDRGTIGAKDTVTVLERGSDFADQE